MPYASVPFEMFSWSSSDPSASVPRVRNRFHAGERDPSGAERVVELELREVAIAGVVDRARELVVAERRVGQADREAAGSDRAIDADARPVFVPRLIVQRGTSGDVERIVLRGVPHAQPKPDVPVADRSRDHDAARAAEPRSHVRDRERQEVASDETGGALLVGRHRRLAGREIHAGRQNDEIGAERQIAANLRVGESGDRARRRVRRPSARRAPARTTSRCRSSIAA